MTNQAYISSSPHRSDCEAKDTATRVLIRPTLFMVVLFHLNREGKSILWRDDRVMQRP